MNARERAGLTQRELAERTDVPQSTIARIEQGQNTSFGTMSKIAFALGKKLKVEFV
jgi:transcriptional regulator with XRE-family HTH domain